MGFSVASAAASLARLQLPRTRLPKAPGLPASPARFLAASPDCPTCDDDESPQPSRPAIVGIEARITQELYKCVTQGNVRGDGVSEGVDYSAVFVHASTTEHAQLIPAAVKALIAKRRFTYGVAFEVLRAVYRLGRGHRGEAPTITIKTAGLLEAATAAINHLGAIDCVNVANGENMRRDAHALACGIYAMYGRAGEARQQLRLQVAVGAWPDAYQVAAVMSASAQADEYDEAVKLYALVAGGDLGLRLVPSNREALLQALQRMTYSSPPLQSTAEETATSAATEDPAVFLSRRRIGALLPTLRRCLPFTFSGESVSGFRTRISDNTEATFERRIEPAVALPPDAYSGADGVDPTDEEALDRLLALATADSSESPAARAGGWLYGLRLLIDHAPADSGGGARFAALWSKDLELARMSAVLPEQALLNAFNGGALDRFAATLTRKRLQQAEKLRASLSAGSAISMAADGASGSVSVDGDQYDSNSEGASLAQHIAGGSAVASSASSASGSSSSGSGRGTDVDEGLDKTAAGEFEGGSLYGSRQALADRFRQQHSEDQELQSYLGRALTDKRVDEAVNERACALMSAVVARLTALEEAEQAGAQLSCAPTPEARYSLRHTLLSRAETLLSVMAEMGVGVLPATLGLFLQAVVVAGMPQRLTSALPLLTGSSVPSAGAAVHYSSCLQAVAIPYRAPTIYRMLPTLVAFGVRPSHATLHWLTLHATQQWVQAQKKQLQQQAAVQAQVQGGCGGSHAAGLRCPTCMTTAAAATSGVDGASSIASSQPNGAGHASGRDAAAPAHSTSAASSPNGVARSAATDSNNRQRSQLRQQEQPIQQQQQQKAATSAPSTHLQQQHQQLRGGKRQHMRMSYSTDASPGAASLPQQHQESNAGGRRHYSTSSPVALSSLRQEVVVRHIQEEERSSHTITLDSLPSVVAPSAQSAAATGVNGSSAGPQVNGASVNGSGKHHEHQHHQRKQSSQRSEEELDRHRPARLRTRRTVINDDGDGEEGQAASNGTLLGMATAVSVTAAVAVTQGPLAKHRTGEAPRPVGSGPWSEELLLPSLLQPGSRGRSAQGSVQSEVDAAAEIVEIESRTGHAGALPQAVPTTAPSSAVASYSTEAVHMAAMPVPSITPLTPIRPHQQQYHHQQQPRLFAAGPSPSSYSTSAPSLVASQASITSLSSTPSLLIERPPWKWHQPSPPSGLQGPHHATAIHLPLSLTCAAAAANAGDALTSGNGSGVAPSEQLRLLAEAGLLAPPDAAAANSSTDSDAADVAAEDEEAVSVSARDLRYMAARAARIPCAREAWTAWSTMRWLRMPAAESKDLLRLLLPAFLDGGLMTGAWEAYRLLYGLTPGPLPSVEAMRMALARDAAAATAQQQQQQQQREEEEQQLQDEGTSQPSPDSDPAHISSSPAAAAVPPLPDWLTALLSGGKGGLTSELVAHISQGADRWAKTQPRPHAHTQRPHAQQQQLDALLHYSGRAVHLDVDGNAQMPPFGVIDDDGSVQPLRESDKSEDGPPSTNLPFGIGDERAQVSPQIAVRSGER